MAKLMYDSANQYSNEKIGQLTDRKVHARHLMTKKDWNDQPEHRWFTVSSLLNKSAHHYLIPMSSSVLTTTCKICSCDPSGVSVIIWLNVCSNVLLRRTTDPNIARTPNTIPALNLKQQHAKHIFCFFIIILQWWLRNKKETVCGNLGMCGGRRVVTHNALLSS